MPYYEVMCIASGRLSRKELSDILRKACLAFMNNGGTVTRIAPLGADGNGPRKLAYAIRQNQVNHKTGFLVNVCAFASPKTLAEVNRQLRLDERVLRHLAVRRPLAACMEPVPDMDAGAPPNSNVDPTDPMHALREFLQEYERDFPEGLQFTAADDEDVADPPGIVTRGQRKSKVDDVVARLRSSPAETGEVPDPTEPLAWLPDLDKPSKPAPL